MPLPFEQIEIRQFWWTRDIDPAERVRGISTNIIFGEEDNFDNFDNVAVCSLALWDRLSTALFPTPLTRWQRVKRWVADKTIRVIMRGLVCLSHSRS